MNNIYHVKFESWAKYEVDAYSEEEANVKFDELLDERVSFSDVSNFEVTDTEIECSELEKKDELL